MLQSCRVVATVLVLFPMLAADARGQRLLEIDGVELRGEARIVQSGGGTCNVLETDTSYEAKKENHGSPMDIWRLDFSVHNGSGRWLDHLITSFNIEAQWPDCTNWDVADATEFQRQYPFILIEWANSNGGIQKSGRNVVSPGETLTETKLFIILRGDPEPRFSNWYMDFDFAAAPPPSGASSPTAPPTASAAQQPPPTTTAEQENLFWQSIMNSPNPADFEAYLAQFPNGVFRALAENRLAALRALEDNASGAAAAPDRNPSRSAGNDLRSQGQPVRPAAPDPTCTEQAEGADCWIELESHPGCYTWLLNRVAGRISATWTAGCSGGLASGSGTLTWVWDRGVSEFTGTLRAGKGTGHWVLRLPDGGVEEGPYVDGEPNGHWVVRFANGTVWEGPLVDGEQNGHWVLRFVGGVVEEGPYVDGARHGHWVFRYADGTVEDRQYVNDASISREPR